MNNYRRMFSSRIWQRGEDYFYENRVSDISKHGNICYAEVAGHHHYQVEIELRDGTITHMDCDCPYAQDAHYCKHMAAVILKMEEDGYFDREEAVAKGENEWEHIITSYTKGRRYMNSSLVNKMDREFGMHMESYKEKLLYSSTCDEALQSLSEAISVMNSLEYDMGYTTALFQTCMLNLQNSTAKEKGAAWAQKELMHGNKKVIAKALMQVVYTKDEEGLKRINQRIEECQKEKLTSELSQLLKNKIEIMKELKYSDFDMLNILRPYHNYEVVMNFEIKHLIQYKEYDKAEQRIRDILKIPSLNDRKRRELRIVLGSLYKLANRYEDYMMFILSSLETTSFDRFLQLFADWKDMYTDQEMWKKAMCDFMVKAEDKLSRSAQIQLYEYFEEYDALLYIVTKYHDIDALQRHQRVLYEYDPEFFTHAYNECICRMIESANTKGQYIHICDALEELYGHPAADHLCGEALLYTVIHCSEKKELQKMLFNLCNEGEE